MQSVTTPATTGRTVTVRERAPNDRATFETALTQSCVGTDEVDAAGALTGRHQKLNKLDVRRICRGDFDSALFQDNVSTGGPNLRIAIKTSFTAALPGIRRVELFTGERTGAGTVEIWSHDAALNQPGVRLGGGGYAQMLANSWQGSNLDNTVNAAANTDYWVVWGMPSGSQSPVEGTGPSGQQYRGSFNNGPWTGPFQSFLYKIRFYCYDRNPGEIEVYGNGCPGSTGRNPPQIGHNGVPTIGLPFEVTLSNARPSTSAFLAIGVSEQVWGTQPLPFNLVVIGASGCLVLCSLDVVLPTTTSAAGTASFTIQVPNVPGLAQSRLCCQWYVVDPGANPLGLAVTQGMRTKIGTR